MSTIPADVSDSKAVAGMEKDNHGKLGESEYKKDESIATTNKSATNTTRMEEAKKAREWFATLSGDDQVVALGFAVDQDFLAALTHAAVATSSSSLSSSLLCASGGTPPTDRPNSEASSLDLMGTPAPDSALEKAATVTNSLASGDQQNESETQSVVPIVSNDEPIVEGAAVASETMSSKEEPQVDEETNVITDAGLANSDETPDATATKVHDSDAFRIRESSIERPADGVITPDEDSQGEQTDKEAGDATPAEVSSPPKDAPPATVSNEKTSTNSQKMEHVSTFMKNVITISPSAFQLVSSDAVVPTADTDLPYPVLSIHPSYVSQKSGQETLSSLDEIMAPGKFLLEPIYNSWNDVVQSMMSGGTIPSSSSTPLHTLLLLRFQLSVLESHQNSLNPTGVAPTTSPHPSITATTGVENNEVNQASFADEATTGVTEAISVGGESHVTETTSKPVNGIPQSDEVDGELSQISKADPVLPEQQLQLQLQDVEEVVEVQTEIGNVAVNKADRVIAMLPSLIKRIASTEQLEGKDSEKIIYNLASFLEVSARGELDLNETLKALDKDVAQRIRVLQEHQNMVSKPPEGATRSSDGDALDEGNPEKEESSKSTDTQGDGSESQMEVEGASATSERAFQTGGKRNSKKKKKRKKRKGGSGPVSSPARVVAPVPSPIASGTPKVEDKVEEEQSVIKPSPPVLEKVDESTQTDVASIEVVAIAVPEVESEIIPPAESISAKQSIDTFHSDKSIGDDSADTVEVEAATEPQKDDTKSSERVGESDDGLQISRVDGVGTVVVTQSVAKESDGSDRAENAPARTGMQPSSEQEHEHEEWETVEVRSRVSRKKGGDKGSNGRFSSLQSYGSKKKNPRTSESRKRIAKRKMVRDILFSVLDSVDEQVRRRKQASDPTPRPVPNAWGTLPSKNKPPPTTGKAGESADTKPPASQRRDGATMRDILMGKQKQSAALAKVSSPQQISKRAFAERVRQRGLVDGAKTTRDKASLISPTAADQNTAPTVPETLSAVSTASAFTETPSAKNIPQTPGLARSESSSSESIGATKPQNNSKQTTKEATPSPPLPTLLSPGNANSATSSVASSLDAPHVVHHNHHSSFLGNENDVGYHLLRVCDRLTRDISQFMKRRDQALQIRRHERGLVLGALQGSLSTIWDKGCKVEMYGSCATDLDLPSSDLDVVVCGLDESEQAAIHAESQNLPDSHSESDSDMKASSTGDSTSGESLENTQQQSPLKATVSASQYSMTYPRMTTNAERVVTLAMELERQPWAVHVKAIPTASVPVIKILADPARLQGASNGSGDWLVQQPEGQSPVLPTSNSADAPEQMPQHYPGSQNNMPWRGADVVNGLLKVDITFEGPEHGGIGSTRFSSRVVEEFSKESCQPPDGTAEVQVLMVLKELLAQRRLNEPFSGGLSSYALLLLVISVVRERAIIRKELERVERQRKLVAAGGGNAVPCSGPSHSTEIQSDSTTTTKEGKPAKQSKGSQKNDKSKSKSSKQNGEKHDGKGNGAAAPRNEGGRGKNKSLTNQTLVEQSPSNGSSGQDGAPLIQGGSVSSSWASIARKTSGSLPMKENQDIPESKASSDVKAPQLKKMSSFAEAVAKGSSTTQVNNDGNKSRAKKSDSKSKGADSKKVKGPAGEEGTKSDPKTKIVSSLPADAPAYEPMNMQSFNAASPTKQTASSLAEEPGSFFPQSFHDVIEVLCAGETTPGKLLMHFLLFYGQHFDSHSTAIDYSNTHVRDANANNGYAVSSPYLQRRNAGAYDPMTGMLTVDPIVVYDPLEGAESNNVARSCFAWSSIRWVFAQSYMTLSSAVEMSAGHQAGIGNSRNNAPLPPQGSGNGQIEPYLAGQQDAAWVIPYGHDESGNVIFDPSTPLLELLLSF